MTFPENLDRLVLYTTVVRGETKTDMLTTPEAIEAVKDGRPIANGTHFVLVDYRSGVLYRNFVMQKGTGWGAKYDESRRMGDWQFQWFWADRTVNLAENTNRCQSCHQGADDDSDYLFTFDRMRQFGVVVD